MRSGLIALALIVAPACGDKQDFDDDLGEDGEPAPVGGEQLGPGGPPQAAGDRNRHPSAHVLVDGAFLASALRTANERIYWLGEGAGGYQLNYVRPAGGPVTAALALDAKPVDLVLVGDDIYWSTERRGRLLGTSLDAPGPVQELYRDPAAVPTAITATEKYIYFGASDGCVRRVHPEAAAELVACGAGTPIAIAAAEPEVFWGTAEGDLFQASADGGVAEKRLVDQSFDSRMFIDDSQVYWLDAFARAVLVIGRDGQEAQQLAGAQYAPAGMTMDRYHIYFTTQSDHSVKRVLKTGGEVEVLIGAQSDPGDIALDPELDRAYWINEGESTIMAMALE